MWISASYWRINRIITDRQSAPWWKDQDFLRKRSFSFFLITFSCKLQRDNIDRWAQLRINVQFSQIKCVFKDKKRDAE